MFRWSLPFLALGLVFSSHAFSSDPCPEESVGVQLRFELNRTSGKHALKVFLGGKPVINKVSDEEADEGTYSEETIQDYEQLFREATLRAQWKEDKLSKVRKSTALNAICYVSEKDQFAIRGSEYFYSDVVMLFFVDNNWTDYQVITQDIREFAETENKEYGEVTMTNSNSAFHGSIRMWKLEQTTP